jgi:hypothetical protein
MSTRPRELKWLILLQSASLALSPVATSLDWSHTKSRVGLTFVNLLLLCYLTWKMSEGRNWAWIVLLVLFLFGLPLSLIAIRADFGRSATLAVLTVLQIVFEGVALLLAFRAPAKDWFRKPAEAASV